MELVALVPFALALMLSAGSPGPSIAALVSRVITNGWRDVAPFLAAMWLGEVIWLTMSMAGLVALAEAFHYAFVTLKWLGVAYLLWLAWKMWHARVEGEQASLPRKGSRLSMFGAGLALTMGNPKIMVFYVALLPSLIDISRFSLASWVIVSLVTVAVLAVVDLAWVALASRARALLRTPRALRVANRISAGAMTGAALAIATRR
ncbi:MAG TPA: LysE family translocator [Thermomicrobiales bacterium]|jgi:threonine/homoserine/homoserine lactone efflux protein|nr:LysE family translocator [Thermomicrobiales bacterium]